MKIRRLGVAAIALACGLLAVAGRAWRRPAPRRGPERILRVPRTGRPLTVDAATDKSPWLELVGQTPSFVTDAGREAIPYSEARVAWGDGYLYLLLYAADPDIRASVKEHDGPIGSDDSFHLELADEDRVYQLDVSPLGTVADRACAKPARGRPVGCDPRWESGALVATDVDGTINEPGGGDEEWVVELALPLRAIGLEGKAGERIALAVSRCDENVRGERECGSWGLAPRVLELDAAPPEPAAAR